MVIHIADNSNTMKFNFRGTISKVVTAAMAIGLNSSINIISLSQVCEVQGYQRFLMVGPGPKVSGKATVTVPEDPMVSAHKNLLKEREWQWMMSIDTEEKLKKYLTALTTNTWGKVTTGISGTYSYFPSNNLKNELDKYFLERYRATEASQFLLSKVVEQDFDHITLARCLLNTKVPKIFAESEILGVGKNSAKPNDWNLDELSILGDIGVSMKVNIYDDGAHKDPKPFIHGPHWGNLVYTPGGLGNSSSEDSRLLDYNLVQSDSKINTTTDLAELTQGLGPNHYDESKWSEGFYSLYKRRLVPVFDHINKISKLHGKLGFIVVPGLGGGCFAIGGSNGKVRETKYHLGEAIHQILVENAERWQNIGWVKYDPFKEYDTKGNKDKLVRYNYHPKNKSLRYSIFPTGESDMKGTSNQLQWPTDFNENEFQSAFGFSKSELLSDPTKMKALNDNIELFTLVAWDHGSYPGNDYWVGSRSTDDGVKAAATDTMYVVTGIEGQYDLNRKRYYASAGPTGWEDIAKQLKTQKQTAWPYFEKDISVSIYDTNNKIGKTSSLLSPATVAKAKASGSDLQVQVHYISPFVSYPGAYFKSDLSVDSNAIVPEKVAAWNRPGENVIVLFGVILENGTYWAYVNNSSRGRERPFYGWIDAYILDPQAFSQISKLFKDLRYSDRHMMKIQSKDYFIPFRLNAMSDSKQLENGVYRDDMVRVIHESSNKNGPVYYVKVEVGVNKGYMGWIHKSDTSKDVKEDDVKVEQILTKPLLAPANFYHTPYSQDFYRAGLGNQMGQKVEIQFGVKLEDNSIWYYVRKLYIETGSDPGLKFFGWIKGEKIQMDQQQLIKLEQLGIFHDLTKEANDIKMVTKTTKFKYSGRVDQYDIPDPNRGVILFDRVRIIHKTWSNTAKNYAYYVQNLDSKRYTNDPLAQISNMGWLPVGEGNNNNYLMDLDLKVSATLQQHEGYNEVLLVDIQESIATGKNMAMKVPNGSQLSVRGRGKINTSGSSTVTNFKEIVFVQYNSKSASDPGKIFWTNKMNVKSYNVNGYSDPSYKYEDLPELDYGEVKMILGHRRQGGYMV